MMVHKNNEQFIKQVTKLIKILIIANIGFLQAQYTAIPDANFEQELINQGIDSENILDGQVLTSDIDTITNLSIISTSISDMTGIQDFSALTHLKVGNNINLTDLDLSNNTALTYLECGDNCSLYLNIESITTNLEHLEYNSNAPITHLDIGDKPNLTYLSCADSYVLSSIDISQCPNLELLECFMCSIADLDVSHNPNLQVINVESNNISQIDLSSNTNLVFLDISSNNLETLNLDQNTALRILNCAVNSLTSLHIQNNANGLITDFDATNNPNLQCIYVDDKAYSDANWTNIDAQSHFVETETECENLTVNESDINDVLVYPNPVTNILFVDNNSTMNIENLCIYSLLGQELVRTENVEVDMSDLTTGTYLLKINFINGKSLIKTIQKE